MKIGIVSDCQYFVSDLGRDWDLHSFAISANDLSFYKIFHSAFSTPARYIQEIFLRLSALESNNQPSCKFIFNPLFDYGELGMLLVLSALREAPIYNGISIYTDSKGSPVGYLLPARLNKEDAFYLNLLSTIDGEIDLTLCNLLFQDEVRCVAIPRFNFNRAQHNGFIYQENLQIYRWVAENAIALLKANRVRDTLPFTAVMPHHAGDVLFFGLAFNQVHSPISRIVVNQAYSQIVEDNTDGLSVLPLKLDLINRSEEFRQGKVTSEGAYFESIRAILPGDSFYLYYRPSRDYNISTFHLIDHFAFAMGRHFYSDSDLLIRNKPIPPIFYPKQSVSGTKKVLLHFDGGWPLKVYPKHLQDRLIKLLLDCGYKITILADSDCYHPDCKVIYFQGYTHFKTLLREHNLLVGMDSFPSHYATHVLGLPTICLFASTRPENSNSVLAANYTYLEKGLSCRPCYGIARCPLYGGTDCYNFVSPETVVSAVEGMIGSIPEKTNPSHEVVVSYIDHFSLADARLARVKLKRIRIRNVRLKATLVWAFLPYLRFTFSLVRKFARTVRVDGFRAACFRVLRFLFHHTKLSG